MDSFGQFSLSEVEHGCRIDSEADVVDYKNYKTDVSSHFTSYDCDVALGDMPAPAAILLEEVREGVLPEDAPAAAKQLWGVADSETCPSTCAATCAASVPTGSPPLQWIYDVDERVKAVNPSNGKAVPQRGPRDAARWLASLPYDDGRSWGAAAYAIVIAPIVAAFFRVFDFLTLLLPCRTQQAVAGRGTTDGNANTSAAFTVPLLSDEELATMDVPSSKAAVGGHGDAEPTQAPEEPPNPTNSHTGGEEEEQKPRGYTNRHEGYIYRRAEEISRRHTERLAASRAMAAAEEEEMSRRLGYFRAQRRVGATSLVDQTVYLF